MGIIKGKDDGIFNPEGEITRAEFTAIAMRFVNVNVNNSETFDDVPQSHWAAKNISDAAALGWITGNGDGIFNPDTSITRASVAKIVNNMLGRKADMEYINANTDGIKLFGDVSVSDWFYADVVEATNAHEYEKKPAKLKAGNKIETRNAEQHKNAWIKPRLRNQTGLILLMPLPK